MSLRARVVLPAVLPALLALGGALAGCAAPGPNPPMERGVCYQMSETKAHQWRFNLVQRAVPNLETCGARLEALRVRFIGLGGQRQTISGVYQGQYIYIDRRGVFTSQEVDGPQYLMLVRTGDGRLAVPGAMPGA
jgi:hypothetical protein